MDHWLRQLEQELHARKRDGLLRQMRSVDAADRTIALGDWSGTNLGSNDYLALANHTLIRSAVAEAALNHGVGSGSSRLVGGNLSMIEEVERRFAAWKGAEACLFTPTGYAANACVLMSLAGPEDVILLDKLCHASLIDAARASGAQMRVFPHGKLEKLQSLLRRYASARRRLIVTEAIFSMDGDCADLPALCDLRDANDAILIVDEAHATGWLGPTGAGLIEHLRLTDRVDVTISTGGKALGSLGGMITAKRIVIDSIVNLARPFIYSTAIPPTQAAAIGAAMDVIERDPQRRQRLIELCTYLRERLADRGWPIVPTPIPTPIVPIVVGSNERALELSARLWQARFFVPAMRPPTVAPGSSRLRISLRSDLREQDLRQFAEVLGGPERASRRDAENREASRRDAENAEKEKE